VDDSARKSSQLFQQTIIKANHMMEKMGISREIEADNCDEKGLRSFRIKQKNTGNLLAMSEDRQAHEIARLVITLLPSQCVTEKIKMVRL
jgi:hypothetical protein